MTRNSINKIPPSLMGFSVVFIMWILFIIADVIDESLLDVDSFIGLWLCIIVPIAYVVLYIVNYVRNHPSHEKLSVYNGFYFSSALLVSVAVVSLTEDFSFPVKQEIRDFFTLNGIEYSFYGIGIFIFVGIVTGIFHIAYALGKRSKAGRK